MFEKLNITACEDITVSQLLRLKENGHPVYRSSHAGNWSLYKLLLSELGLPDCIWDVTCIYHDVNNQPRYKLVEGQAIPLLSDMSLPTNRQLKQLTPYIRVKNSNQPLANFHVAPLKKIFGDTITSQSECLLEYEKDFRVVFNIIEKYLPEQFGRYVLPCGCMVPLEKTTEEHYRAVCAHGSQLIKQSELAESMIGTLKDLNNLFWGPVGYVPTGGVVYSFELVIVCYYLWMYWKFGDKTIYELSGPDLINYSTKDRFVLGLEKVFKVLALYAPTGFIPRKIEVKIVPATLFRFGYPNNDTVAKSVMLAHEKIQSIQTLKRQSKDIPGALDSLNKMILPYVETIKNDGDKWNIFHNPSKDSFYSQHDMLLSGARMNILEEYLDVPFSSMSKILGDLPHKEKGLIRQLFKS